jgi:hypothetical protein
VTVARPSASVVAGAPVMLADAPEPGAVKATATPETGLPLESVTITTSELANAVPTVVLWLSPLLTAIVAGALAVFVSWKFAGATPVTVAVTVKVPAVLDATAATDAWPFGSVVGAVMLRVAVAPVLGTAYVTVTPGTGLPNVSVTVTRSGFAYAVLTGALCGVAVLAAVTALGTPAVFVRLKVALDAPPGIDAVTEYAPDVWFAVAVTLAMPLAFVVATVALRPALAPVPGAANVTVAPDTGLPAASVTRTDSAAPNAAVTCALCGEPD